MPSLVLLFLAGLFSLGAFNQKPDVVEETQHAMCNITTKEINASANATVIRQLKGVCTSKELHNRLERLEKKLLGEIEKIKRALHIDDDFDHDYVLQPKTLKTQYDYDYFNAIQGETISEVRHPQVTQYLGHTTQKPTFKTTVSRKTTQKPPQTAVKFTESPKKQGYFRDIEAAKQNGTIRETELGRSFLYFWRIYNIEEVIATESYIDSSVFHVLGHALKIRIYLHHSGTNYMALELRNKDGFIFKHRFTVFNQRNELGDLTSQVLGKDVGLFRVSNQKLANSDFTLDGSLIIKATIVMHM